jgi:cob(I)alamin adenosyltransferase
MVYLNRIYTKTGDDGETSLGDGSRVPKTHLRISAYGNVDELNSVIGLAMSVDLPKEIAGWLLRIQNNLFDLGADLCVPEREPGRDAPDRADTARLSDEESGDEESETTPLRVTAEQVEQLEHWIDSANERLTPLESFILPGGTAVAAHLHHARTVCRRAEIAILQLAAQEPINPQIAIYLNRLSDLLFVLARVCNNNGEDDVLWAPGKSSD